MTKENYVLPRNTILLLQFLNRVPVHVKDLSTVLSTFVNLNFERCVN